MLDSRAKRIAGTTGDALRAFGFTIDRLGGELTDIQDALVDLLIEHQPISIDRLPEELLDNLEELGLLSRTGSTIRSTRDVRPYSDGQNDFYVVSDSETPESTGSEHVLGVGQASLTLASLVPRSRVERALDIGTGSGIQALHLSTHAAQIVATDLSAEALECAALSAALSNVEFELRQGSLYEPVEGERFDLIVSNPPFVISPEKSFTYRDAGREGDDFVRELISTAHHHLNADGWFVTLANWLHLSDRDWRERLMEWIAPTGCDAWVVERDRIAPEEYVRTWLSDSSSDDPALSERWLQWFTDHDVDAIGFGWVILHASGRALPHRRFEHLAHAVEHPMGPWVSQRFLAADLASDCDDVELLAQHMTLQEHSLHDQRLTIERGWRRSAQVDSLTLEFLSHVDPSTPVGAALAATAGGTIDLESAADLVRALLEFGLLVPVSGGLSTAPSTLPV